MQGTIVLKYLVGTDGLISDVTAISGPQELGEEGIRIIKTFENADSGHERCK